jgi:hypothetical protein
MVIAYMSQYLLDEKELVMFSMSDISRDCEGGDPYGRELCQ